MTDETKITELPVWRSGAPTEAERDRLQLLWHQQEAVAKAQPASYNTTSS